MKINKNTIKLLVDRDYRTFSAFYHEYANRIAFWIYRIIGSKEDAEDLAMDIITDLPDLLKKTNIDNEKAFKSWLYLVIKSRALNFIKRRKIIKEVSLNENIIDSNLIDSIEINPILGKTSSNFHLSDLKKVLNEDEYKIIYCKFYLNFSRKDIAAKYNFSEKQVKRKIETAYKKIRTYLLKEGDYQYE